MVLATMMLHTGFGVPPPFHYHYSIDFCVILIATCSMSRVCFTWCTPW